MQDDGCGQNFGIAAFHLLNGISVLPNTLQMSGVMGSIVVLDGVRQKCGCQVLVGMEWFGHKRYYQQPADQAASSAELLTLPSYRFPKHEERKRGPNAESLRWLKFDMDDVCCLQIFLPSY
jgi:hypothetical protein